MLIKLEQELTLKQILESNPQKVLCLYFTATWCGPCKAISPEVDKLNTAYNDNVLFIKHLLSAIVCRNCLSRLLDITHIGMSNENIIDIVNNIQHPQIL